MKLRERCKIAKKLNESLKINIYKDFVFNEITHNGLRILGGILIGSFNSPDSYRPFAPLIPLFIPEESSYNVSFGEILRHYSVCQEDISIQDMITAYNKYIAPYQNFYDIYDGLDTYTIPNFTTKLIYLEFKIYVCLILGKYDEFFSNIKTFRELEASGLSRCRRDTIERITLVESLVMEGNVTKSINQLISWQNFTVKALKLPSDLLVEPQ